MICTEFFYHCDHHGCESHAYVPGEKMVYNVEEHRYHPENKIGIQQLPEHWRSGRDGKVFCAKHGSEAT